MIGGTVMFAAAAILPAMLLGCMERRVMPSRESAGVWRAAAILVLTLAIIVGELAFDWEQLAPGIGALPHWVEVPYQCLVAVGLFYMQRRTLTAEVPWRRGMIAAAVSWALLGITMAAMSARFVRGVRWS